MRAWLRHDSQRALLTAIPVMSAFAIISAVSAVQRGTSWIPVVVFAILALASVGWFTFLLVTRPHRATKDG